MARGILWQVALASVAAMFLRIGACDAATERETFKDPISGIEFVLVPGGTFEMGDIFGDGNIYSEMSVHSVTLSGFWLGKYEVTQTQWQKVMGSNPSKFKGSDLPVEQVSWDDCQEFIRRLNKSTGKKYRLPTEAEWEYAARSGGKRERWAGTSDKSELDGYAWYAVNSGLHTNSVGRKKPNGLGLYDMTGNVDEWVYDIPTKYPTTAQVNPSGPPQVLKVVKQGDQSGRIVRGGQWRFAVPATTTHRSPFNRGARMEDLGFRLCLSLQP